MPRADTSWQARPWAARSIRIAVVLVPLAAGMAAAIAASAVLPGGGDVLGFLARTVVVVATSSAAVWAVDRVARRALPLAALMQLSLIFPDQAPSRFKAALRAGSSKRLEKAVQEMQTNGLPTDPGQAARAVVELIGAIGDHDRRTRGHSERVRLFADLIGEELHLTKEERQKLQWGALLHDLGKIMVPGEILNKPGKPTEDEWEILKGHPAAGMDLIAPLRDFLGEWVHAIGGHHEKWNGGGYPNGLAGEQIPRSAGIVAVADAFEVMTSVRSYKKAMSLEDARSELTRCAGVHFSPEAVRAMLSVSLGHPRLVMGPLASLAHLPFITTAMDATGRLATLSPGLTSAASAPVAAMATVAIVGMGVTAAPTSSAKPEAPKVVAVETPANPSPEAPPSTAGERQAPVSAAENDRRAPGRDRPSGKAGRDAPEGDDPADRPIGRPVSDPPVLPVADDCTIRSADPSQAGCWNDGVGPVISDVAVPASVDAGTTLEVSWRASDPSGLRRADANTPTAWIVVSGAQGFVSWCEFPTPGRQVSGTETDAQFIATCTLPANAVSGDYTVTIDALDVHDNHAGIAYGTFSVTNGSADADAPVLSAVATDKADYRAGEDVTITFRATDETGVRGVVPWAFGPNGRLTDDAGKLWLDYGLATLVSGDAKDGLYSITLKLSDNAAAGSYNLWFSSRDEVGNRDFNPCGVGFTVS